MDLIADFVALIIAAATGLMPGTFAPLERTVERTYQVPPGAIVTVELAAGRISVTPSPDRTVRVRLTQRAQTTNQREAESAFAGYTVELTQRTGDVRLVTRRTPGFDSVLWRRVRVNMEAEVAVPANVAVDLHTHGGSIEIRGGREAQTTAHTSGGSIGVDGGPAPIDISTSGGSIRVGRIGTTLRARTSGGSITVDEVAASARDVDVSTSGGSVRVGVHPAAHLAFDASTSGGSAAVEGLSVNISHRTRTQVTGTLNGGGGRLNAHTSGGSVRISATSRQ